MSRHAVWPLAAALMASAMVALPRAGEAQGLIVSGYGDIEFNVKNVGGDTPSETFFDNHHFNLIVLGNITDNVFAAGEIEYEHAGDEVALEYGYVGYTGFKNVRLMGGKFLVPFGRFNKDLHPTWINKMVDRPNGLKNILPVGYNDIGLWVSAGLPVGNSGTRVAIDGFIVNGLLGPDGGDIRDFRDNIDESRTGVRDKNKAVGGRLGLEFIPQGLDFAVSVYNGNYSDDDALNLNLFMFGADAAYRSGGFETRVEIVTANQESTGGDLNKTGGYGQVAYLTHLKLEPVVRFSFRDMPGDSEDQSRLSFGINYYVGVSSVLRLDYHINYEKVDVPGNNAIAAQFAVGF